MTNKRAHQTPKPFQEQIAGRLENVRAKAKAKLSAFHARLAEGWSDPVGLRAAQNYHGGTREAPARYLKRVAEVYGVRPAYLLTGEEPVFEEDEERWRIDGELAAAKDDWETRRMEEFWAAFPELQQMPLQVRHFFLEVWSSFNGTGWLYAPVRGHLHPDVGKRVADLLMAPFGKGGRPIVLSDEFADYATAMLLALNLAVRVPFSPPQETTKDP